MAPKGSERVFTSGEIIYAKTKLNRTETMKEITIYHSPDADDAFMFYGLSSGAITHPDYLFKHELCDIQSLNDRSVKGEIDCTAVSVHAFPYLNDQYTILACGASMGGAEYGPRLIANKQLNLTDIKTIALPGALTSATLAMRLYLKEAGIEADCRQTDFDKVQDLVASGKVDAGLIIHEGQVTSQNDGFTILLDLGKWWWDSTNLPLPLGINVVKKDLGEEAIAATAQVLKASIAYGLEHRKEALEYALQYGRGLSNKDADTFVAMYVNEWTLDMGKKGRESLKLFLKKGFDAGFLPDNWQPEFFRA